MANRESLPGRNIDQELRGLGSRIEYPATPNQSVKIRRRIEENTGEVASRRNTRWFPKLSSKWVAAAALLLLVVAPFSSPGFRDNFSGFFTSGMNAGAGSSAESGGAAVSSDQAAGGAAQSSESGSESDAPSSSSGAASSSSGETQPGDFDRKVIKTADLGIRSDNVRGSVSEAQEIATQLGGNVLSSQVDRGGGSVSAELTLSVPSNEFERTLEELRGLGEVTTDAAQGNDVTEEFVDLESRERNLLATEESLLKLYDESEDVNDTLSIQRELTNVRGEIEQVQGRIRYLEQRSETSRIDLSIAPVEQAAAPPDWSPASTVSKAWSASLGFLQVIATAFLSVAVFSWWLAPVLVLGLVLWRVRSRRTGSDTP